MDFSLQFFLHVVMPQLLAAIPVTVALTAIAAIGCIPVAVGLAIALQARRRCFRLPAQVFVLVIRGTPLLVQIYMIYYGLGSLIPGSWMRHGALAPLLRDAFAYGAVALIVNEAAYVAVIVRSGLDNIPLGEREAARALALPNWVSFRKIFLPRAFMMTLPVLVSELILLLKSTVLVSTITVFDVLGTANVIRFESFHIFEPLLGATIVYVCLVGIISLGGSLLERRIAHRAR